MSDTATLLDVIDPLTIEHPFKATIEGKTRWVRRDPLIKTLREMVASSLTGGNGTSSNVARLPFDADALEQYDKLEGIILTAYATINNTPARLTPEENLRAWYAAFIASNPTDAELTTATNGWAVWVTQIEAKIGRPVVLELIDTTTATPVPCPECGFGWFTKILNRGPGWVDSEQRVALTAIYRPDGAGGLEKSTVECACCGWRVSGSTRIRGFAWDIEKGDAA